MKLEVSYRYPKNATCRNSLVELSPFAIRSSSTTMIIEFEYTMTARNMAEGGSAIDGQADQ